MLSRIERDYLLKKIYNSLSYGAEKAKNKTIIKLLGQAEFVLKFDDSAPVNMVFDVNNIICAIFDVSNSKDGEHKIQPIEPGQFPNISEELKNKHWGDAWSINANGFDYILDAINWDG